MVWWWPSLWGSDSSGSGDGAYRLVPSSQWQPGSCTDTVAGGRLNGVFVPVEQEQGLDELGALLDARKTIDAEIARHRRLASSHTTTAEMLDDPTPDEKEHHRPAVGAPTAAAAVLEVGEENAAESMGVASTPSTARRSRKRGRTTTLEDDGDVSVQRADTDLSSLSLEELDLKQDFFTVANNSPHERSLDGCSVHSAAGGQIFKFPPGTKLSGGGGRITVWSGAKNKSKVNVGKRGGGKSDIFWTARYVWNDNGDTAILRGPGEEELDRITSEIVFEQETVPPQGEHGDDLSLQKPESSVEAFLFLANLDLLQERVTICNGGARVVALEGWQLRSGKGGQQFDFSGTGHVLPGGAHLTIHSGKEGKKDQAASQLADSTNDHLFWTTRSIWADTGDTAVLVAPDGIEVDRRTAKPAYHQHHEPPPLSPRDA